jgi:hypothetical protein|tara:strand:+ start:65 stop:1483 length:1419 start_codon:yes stop_codon:yes gene_type:complete
MSKVWSEKKTTTLLLTRPDTKASTRSYGSSRAGTRAGEKKSSGSRQSVRSTMGETTQSYGTVTPWSTTHTLWESARRGNFNELKHLVEAHAQTNNGNVRGWTPLHVASKSDKPHAVDLLLRSKCDWSVRTKGEKSALDIAIENNNHEVVRQLLRHIDITIPQCERLSRNAARKRRYQLQEVFRRYLARLKAGETVKYKPPRNEDIEPIDLKPPPIIPATNRFGENIVLTPAEEDHMSYELGSYDNLRAITHKRELAHLRKPVLEWTGPEFAFWVTQQPLLELGGEEYATAIQQGPITGELLASLVRSDFAALLSKLGLSVAHRKFVLRDLCRKMMSDKSYDTIQANTTEGTQKLYISRAPAPLYQMIGAILVDLNTTTLVDVRKLLKKTKISSKASLRKFVFMYDDGARIPEEAEKWCLASSFFPVLVLREGTKEEEEAAKAKIIEDRKEMMRRKTEEREEERKRMESIANR